MKHILLGLTFAATLCLISLRRREATLAAGWMKKL